MKRDEIMQVLATVFCDIFDDDNLQITEKTCADDIDDWDSLNHINLIVGIEKRLNLKFSLAELKLLENVGDMIELILRKLNVK